MVVTQKVYAKSGQLSNSIDTSANDGVLRTWEGLVTIVRTFLPMLFARVIQVDIATRA